MKPHLIQQFSPERWLKFPNHFSEQSLLWKKLWLFSIPVGLSNYGMCGGLSSTALDLFFHNRLPPTRTTPPTSTDDSILFDWLKQRQVESISVRDFWNYFTLLFTNAQDDKKEIALAWAQIKKELLLNHPVQIGLQRAKVDAWYKIHQIAGIVKNHQVVVWGFTENGDEVTLHLYDPKNPQDKDVKITFTLQAAQGNRVQCNPPEIGPIYAFFKTSYSPKSPPSQIGVEEKKS